MTNEELLQPIHFVSNSLAFLSGTKTKCGIKVKAGYKKMAKIKITCHVDIVTCTECKSKIK